MIKTGKEFGFLTLANFKFLFVGNQKKKAVATDCQMFIAGGHDFTQQCFYKYRYAGQCINVNACFWTFVGNSAVLLCLFGELQ